MSKIANIDRFSRPREKALTNGIKSLSDIELLALIIRCGTRGSSAIEIGEHIFKKYGSLSNLLSTDVYSLMDVKGIKEAKAIELMAVIELAKRASNEVNRSVSIIDDADSAYNYVKAELENETQEIFVVLFLNVKLKLIKKEHLFVGGECSSIVDINLLFKKAISCGARKIICIHNHPSGDPLPSNEDINLTNRIRKIADIVKIELLDHIIIGKNDYFSFSKMEL